LLLSYSIFHEAARNGQLNVIKSLIEKKLLDLNRIPIDALNDTLEETAKAKKWSIVKYLIEESTFIDPLIIKVLWIMAISQKEMSIITFLEHYQKPASPVVVHMLPNIHNGRNVDIEDRKIYQCNLKHG